jgi:hypothetical protein
MKEEEVDEVFDEPGSDPGALKDIVRVVKSPYSAPNLNDLQAGEHKESLIWEEEEENRF